MRQLWKRLSFWLTGAVVIGCLAVVTLCWSYRLWSFDGFRVYQAMANECHPAWRDFHYGRVRAGDPVEEVIARTQPMAVEQKGRWMVLTYDDSGEGLRFTGLTAIAYDGRMVCAYAWSCTWVRLFFDELSDEQSREFLGSPRDDPRRVGIVVVVR